MFPSFYTFFLAILFAVLMWMVYRIVLRPLYWLRYYSKQGAWQEYFPLFGGYGKRIMETPKTGHFNATYRRILQEQNPDVPAFVTNLGSQVMVALVKPALPKEFLLKQEDYYVKTEAITDLFKCFVGDGLVTSEGETWKKHRKLVSNVFHFDFIKETVPIIIETTREFLDKIKARDSLDNVNIMQELEKITGEVVGRVFFGQQFSKYTIYGRPFIEKIYAVGLPLVQETLGVWNHGLGPWFIKAGILPRHKKIMDGMREIREFVRKIIEERRKQIGHSEHRNKTNLLDLLLKTQENSNEGFLTTEEIIDEFLTFFIVGTDTTSHLLTLAIYKLTQDPVAYRKTLQESLIFQGKTREISYSDVDTMNYTMGVLKETLRVTNPAFAAIMRRSLKDHQLSNNFKIKKGTLVGYFTSHNGFKEEYFEEPNVFKPERWLAGNDPDAKWKKEPYSYTPFSAGPRNCIGQHLALLESRIIMGIFLTEFDMKVQENYSMKVTARFLLEPLDPFLLNLKIKNPQ